MTSPASTDLGVVTGVALANANEAKEDAEEALETAERADDTALHAAQTANNALQTAQESKDNSSWQEQRILSLEQTVSRLTEILETEALTPSEASDLISEEVADQVSETLSTENSIQTFTSAETSETQMEAIPESEGVKLVETPLLEVKARKLRLV
jgi:hypothetical protein